MVTDYGVHIGSKPYDPMS